MDATVLMNLEEKVKSWPNHAGQRDRRRRSSADYGYRSRRSTSTSPVLTEPEGTTIQRATDIRFLRALARRNGFDCYVQAGAVHGRRPAATSRRAADLARPQAVLSVDARHGRPNVSRLQRPLRRWRSRRRPRPPGSTSATKTGTARRTPPRRSQQPLGVEGRCCASSPTARVAAAGHRAVADAASCRRAARRSSTARPGRSSPRDRRARRRRSSEPGGARQRARRGRLFNGQYYVTRVHHTLAAGRLRAALRGAAATPSARPAPRSTRRLPAIATTETSAPRSRR